MNDDLTPPFEEPSSPADDCDEAVEGAAEFDQYDLSQWVDDGDLLVGFTGMVKFLREDGSLMACHVGVGINHFEAIGLHHKAIDEITAEAEMGSCWGEDD